MKKLNSTTSSISCNARDASDPIVLTWSSALRAAHTSTEPIPILTSRFSPITMAAFCPANAQNPLSRPMAVSNSGTPNTHSATITTAAIRCVRSGSVSSHLPMSQAATAGMVTTASNSASTPTAYPVLPSSETLNLLNRYASSGSSRSR